MTYFFKQTHISRRRTVLIFSDLLRQITLCLSSKDGSATLRNSDTGAKNPKLFNMNWTIVTQLTESQSSCSPHSTNVKLLCWNVSNNDQKIHFEPKHIMIMPKSNGICKYILDLIPALVYTIFTQIKIFVLNSCHYHFF